jgi:hypothetical protein
MTLYLIQKQTGEFLHKQLGWTPPMEPSQLFRTPHKDVALNQLIELNTKDVSLRAAVVTCDTDDKGLPLLADPLASAS